MKAFARLLLSGIVARHHLRWRAERPGIPGGFGSFVLAGPTKAGKTSMARAVCQVFGFSETLSIRTAQTESPASLWGRRVQDLGGSYRLEPADALRRPFLCVDELDKAPADLQRALLLLAQGDAQVPGEGDQVLEIAPTVLFCVNDSPARIHEAYRRRSVVLDLAPLRPLLVDVHLAMRELLSGALPQLDLDRLRPPAAELSQSARQLLLVGLKEGLTEIGWELLDDRALEVLTLGRAALVDVDLDTAAAATAVDYLACARTLDQTRPGTPARLVEQLGGTGGMVPHPARAEQEIISHRRSAAKEKQAESLKLITARAEWAEEIHQLTRDISRVPPAHRAKAAGLRAALTDLRRRVLATRSDESLTEVLEVGARPIEEAQRLAVVVDDERRQADLDKAWEAERKRRAKADEAALRAQRQEALRADAAHKRRLRKALGERRRELQELYDRVQLKPSENWLAKLVAAGCVQRVETVRQREAPQGLDAYRSREHWRNAPRIVTEAMVGYQDCRGAVHDPKTLRAPGTRAVREVIEAAAAADGIQLRPPRGTLRQPAA